MSPCRRYPVAYRHLLVFDPLQQQQKAKDLDVVGCKFILFEKLNPGVVLSAAGDGDAENENVGGAWLSLKFFAAGDAEKENVGTAPISEL